MTFNFRWRGLRSCALPIVLLVTAFSVWLSASMSAAAQPIAMLSGAVVGEVLDEDELSQEEFANLVIDALAKLTDRKFTFDAERFRLMAGDDENSKINLSNVYQEHLALESSQREAHIVKIASVFSSNGSGLPEDFEEARSNLRPKIWSRQTFENVKLRNRLEGGTLIDLPLRPLGEHLYTALVFDTENSMRSVSNQDLKKWEVTYEEAMKVACDNLDKSTVAYSRIGDHFHSSISGDSYDSSRVMLGRVRTFEVKGEHVALVPNRNLLQIAGSEDPDSLKMMFELAAMEEGGRPLSPLPLVWREDKWIDWVPPVDHKIRPIYDGAKLEFFGRLYGDQKKLLKAIYDKEDSDVFVASFSAMQNPETKVIRSYCVWSNGVDSLLPETQLVVICAKEGEMTAVGEWSRVREVVGELIEVDNSVYPSRYRVRKFPTAEQLKAIGKLEL